MASLLKRNGTWSIRFVVDGQRRMIALGTRSERVATGCKLRIENMLDHRTTGHPLEAETTVWLAGLKPIIRGASSKSGLLDKPQVDEAGPMTVSRMLSHYFASRRDVKPATIIQLGADAAKPVDVLRSRSGHRHDHRGRRPRF